MMAARGWFTSWAMEAVISPMVITRETCASSACATDRASSALFRSVMFSTMPRMNCGIPSVPGTNEPLTFTQIGSPPFRRYRFTSSKDVRLPAMSSATRSTLCSRSSSWVTIRNDSSRSSASEKPSSER